MVMEIINPIPVTVNSDITLIAEFELIDADKDGVGCS